MQGEDLDWVGESKRSTSVKELAPDRQNGVRGSLDIALDRVYGIQPFNGSSGIASCAEARRKEHGVPPAKRRKRK